MSELRINYQNFSYFDQFKEMELDLSRFLETFSKEEYELKFSNLQPVKVNIKNIFEQYRILDRYKIDGSSFTRYSIQNNEFLEYISYKFYDTVDFWWIIAAFNDIRNPFFDMPLSEDQIIQYAETLEDREGKYPKDIYYKLLSEDNETKRQILVPRKRFIADIIWNYREAMLKDSNL